MVREFGRTIRQNGSRGTDHGRGALTLLIGDSVRGQVIDGGDRWPGLEGNHLGWSTDFRDIFWEFLARHMGAGESEIRRAVPHFSPSPVGAIG